MTSRRENPKKIRESGCMAKAPFFPRKNSAPSHADGTATAAALKAQFMQSDLCPRILFLKQAGQARARSLSDISYAAPTGHGTGFVLYHLSCTSAFNQNPALRYKMTQVKEQKRGSWKTNKKNAQSPICVKLCDNIVEGTSGTRSAEIRELLGTQPPSGRTSYLRRYRKHSE